MTVIVDADPLESFVRTLLEEVDVPAAGARQIADSLVTANLRGHNSHGVRRLPLYFARIRGEHEHAYTIDPTATPRVESGSRLAATVDGRFAFGQIVGRTATDAAVERAEEHGMSVVGVRDATHLGRIGEWSERATDSDMIFAAFVNIQGPGNAAPPGSADRRFLTNPISFGFPTFDALDFPIVLDIATTQVADGKFRERRAKGEPLPEEWTVTADGGSVTDAEAFYEQGVGAMLPLGGRASGYKGFGLSMVAELFAGIVGRGRVAGQSDIIRGNAATFIAIDPTLFSTRDEVEADITALATYLRETEFSPHVSPGIAAYGDEALLPGEPEYLITADRRENGIPLPEKDVEALYELARKHGVVEHVPSAFETVVSADD